MTDQMICDVCDGTGVNHHDQLWPGRAPCRVCFSLDYTDREVISKGLREGDPVYMPELGDSPKTPPMTFIDTYDNGFFTMAVMRHRDGLLTEYPLRFVEKVPPQKPTEPTDPIWVGMVLAAIVVMLCSILARMA